MQDRILNLLPKITTLVSSLDNKNPEGALDLQQEVNLEIGALHFSRAPASLAEAMMAAELKIINDSVDLIELLMGLFVLEKLQEGKSKPKDLESAVKKFETLGVNIELMLARLTPFLNKLNISVLKKLWRISSPSSGSEEASRKQAVELEVVFGKERAHIENKLASQQQLLLLNLYVSCRNNISSILELSKWYMDRIGENARTTCVSKIDKLNADKKKLEESNILQYVNQKEEYYKLVKNLQDGASYCEWFLEQALMLSHFCAKLEESILYAGQANHILFTDLEVDKVYKVVERFFSNGRGVINQSQKMEELLKDVRGHKKECDVVKARFEKNSQLTKSQTAWYKKAKIEEDKQAELSIAVEKEEPKKKKKKKKKKKNKLVLKEQESNSLAPIEKPESSNTGIINYPEALEPEVSKQDGNKENQAGSQDAPLVFSQTQNSFFPQSQLARGSNQGLVSSLENNNTVVWGPGFFLPALHEFEMPSAILEKASNFVYRRQEIDNSIFEDLYNEFIGYWQNFSHLETFSDFVLVQMHILVAEKFIYWGEIEFIERAFQNADAYYKDAYFNLEQAKVWLLKAKSTDLSPDILKIFTNLEKHIQACERQIVGLKDMNEKLNDEKSTDEKFLQCFVYPTEECLEDANRKLLLNSRLKKIDEKIASIQGQDQIQEKCTYLQAKLDCLKETNMLCERILLCLNSYPEFDIVGRLYFWELEYNKYQWQVSSDELRVTLEEGLKSSLGLH